MIFSQLPRSQQGNRILLMIWDVENGLFKKGMAFDSSIGSQSIESNKAELLTMQGLAYFQALRNKTKTD